MPNTLNVKIHDFDDESHNLVVSFSTDESAKPVEEYQTISFQPHNFSNPHDAQSVLLEIAKSGYFIVQQQDSKEKLAANTGAMVDFRDLIGTTQTFNFSDIAPTEVPIPSSLTDIVVK